jgi:hypothetical protein
VKAGRTPRFVYEPPAWIKVLSALRSGIKGDLTGTVGTQSQIARRLGMSRERVGSLVKQALAHKAVERPFGDDTRIFRKSFWGKLLLQSWIRAGWRPK